MSSANRFAAQKPRAEKGRELDDSVDEVRHFVVGPIQTNCYAYVSAGKCLVVDPGFAGEAIARELSDVDVEFVVATHDHGDHVGGVAELVEATHATFAMSGADERIARESTGDGHHPGETVPPVPDRRLVEGDVLSVGRASFTVWETPGHTAGGLVLVGGGSATGIVFVGDTLFAGSAGRTDLETGDPEALMRSLVRLRRDLPRDAHILCGHGPTTTMEAELRGNPFLAG